MSTLRVLLFSHEYPPFLFGGVGTFVKDLAYGLANKGVDVSVLTGIPTPVKQSYNLPINQDKITTIRLPYPNLVPRHITFQMINNRRLKQILKEIKPDVIHGQSGSCFPAVVSMKKCAPVIITYHTSPCMFKSLSIDSVADGGSFGDFFSGVVGYPVYESSYRLEYRNSTSRVAVSKSLMMQLRGEMNVNGGSFDYIRNGVDLSSLDELCENSCSETPITKKPFLLFGGRLFWSKGVLRLLDLAYLLEKKYRLDLQIVIYGSGPMYKRILQRKNEYGLNNVILRQFSSRSEFLSAMKDAMCVLIPSPFEAAPMVLLESMCMGKIAFMFNLPYAREFTENGKYGVLCTDVADMALKVKELFFGTISTSSLEHQIRSFARKKYNIENTATAYYKQYKKMTI